MNLEIIEHEGQLVANSRQVAEMVEKRHADLIRDIKNYENVLTNAKLRSLSYFIEASYRDNKGEPRTCYLVTKKGCDMIANKMTGEKGILFSASYIDRFYEMEQQLHKPMSHLEIVAANAMALVEQEKKMKAIAERQDKQDKELQDIRDVVTLNTTNWRKDTQRLITKIAQAVGGHEYIQELRRESYRQLNSRMRANLECRLNNLKQRMADNGASKTRINQTCILDVIEADHRLQEGYVAVVQDLFIKYGGKL